MPELEEKKKKKRTILASETPQPPTTGAKIKEITTILAEKANVKGFGVGGTLKKWEAEQKGEPGKSFGYRLGMVRGAGVKTGRGNSGIRGMGRKPIVGLKFKVKF
jgi:hypothetical protein